MGKNLVIVESPAKARTIERYLGPGFKVLASYGHVRDLIPKEGAVIWFDNFAIPSDAPHMENAHLFIDYIMEPEVVALVGLSATSTRRRSTRRPAGGTTLRS